MKIPATVGMLTYNSADTLQRALESVKEFDDIVICDGGSTDGTLNIARAFGARVIPQHPEFKNPNGTLKDYAGVRNQLLEAAKYDWFLYIDSDETASPGLVSDIHAATTSSVPLVYRVPIGIMMDGRYIKHSSNYPGYQHRFFNRLSAAHFVRPVHERIEFAAGTKVGTFAHPWYVHTTRDYWHHYLRETGGYRPLEITKACVEPWGTYLLGALWQLRICLVIVAKSLWNYLRYGFRDTLPVRGELGRAAVPLVLVWKIFICKLSRKSTS
ncbi:MAG: glycosyltransferase family 2 protein [Patescibacteria group bacterium]